VPAKRAPDRRPDRNVSDIATTTNTATLAAHDFEFRGNYFDIPQQSLR
jgi:hypothetical protein